MTASCSEVLQTHAIAVRSSCLGCALVFRHGSLLILMHHTDRQWMLKEDLFAISCHQKLNAILAMFSDCQGCGICLQGTLPYKEGQPVACLMHEP